MRTRHARVPTVARLAAGATALVFPATAMAVSAAPILPSTQPPAVLHAFPAAAVQYGHDAVLTGTASARIAGSALALRYRPFGAAAWRIIARGHVHRDGHFRLGAPIGRSGLLQIVSTRTGRRPAIAPSPVDFTTPGTTTGTATATATGTGTTSGAATTTTAGQDSVGFAALASQVRAVAVRPLLSLDHPASGTAAVGQSTELRGQLLPGVAGRRVVLEALDGDVWRPAAAARTQAGGSFAFSYVAPASGGQRLQVAFAGDRLSAHADSPPLTLTPMEPVEVSWYEDAGDTACGFHATYGIASRTLPCGTQVRLSYGGRTVVATVDDRGPYVFSRLYDLNQNTAAALGMDGVAEVLASV